MLSLNNVSWFANRLSLSKILGNKRKSIQSSNASESFNADEFTGSNPNKEDYLEEEGDGEDEQDLESESPEKNEAYKEAMKGSGRQKLFPESQKVEANPEESRANKLLRTRMAEAQLEREKEILRSAAGYKKFDFGKAGIESEIMGVQAISEDMYSSSILGSIIKISKDFDSHSNETLFEAARRYLGKDLLVKADAERETLISIIRKIATEQKDKLLPLTQSVLEGLEIEGTTSSSAALDLDAKGRFLEMCAVNDVVNKLKPYTTFVCLMRAGLSVDFSNNAENTSDFTLNFERNGTSFMIKFTISMLKRYVSQVGVKTTMRALSRSFAKDIFLIAKNYKIDTPIALKFNLEGENRF
jgi:hypothetical protein